MEADGELRSPSSSTYDALSALDRLTGSGYVEAKPEVKLDEDADDGDNGSNGGDSEEGDGVEFNTLAENTIIREVRRCINIPG